MIYTVTFNPSLDYIVSVEQFRPGGLNRATKELLFPGGKGINVSIVLKNLGMESTNLGFIAGFTGEKLRKEVRALSLTEKFIELEQGMTRINIKIRSGEESEINGIGPVIDEQALQAFYRQLIEIKEDDILVLAGSIPASLPDTVYRDIFERLTWKGVRIVVDAAKELLLNVLPYHPFLIKPNNHELGDLFGVNNLRDRKEIAEYAKKLQEMGARNVLVSMADDGAYLLAENGEEYMAKAPEGKAVNSVGAGDSMVAGFLYGLSESSSYDRAFYTALCAGSASAFSENLAMKDEIEELRKQYI